MALNEQRTCALCRQPLPPRSKLTTTRIPQDEAERHGWHGEQNPDCTLTIDMCLQCQIDRSENSRKR